MLAAAAQRCLAIPLATFVDSLASKEFDLMQPTFFLSRVIVVSAAAEAGKKGMAEWRESLFATMARNARTAAYYYNIPPNCVIELGTKIAI